MLQNEQPSHLYHSSSSSQEELHPSMIILIISIRVIKTAVAVHHRVSGTSHYINHCVIATRGIILHQPTVPPPIQHWVTTNKNMYNEQNNSFWNISLSGSIFNKYQVKRYKSKRHFYTSENLCLFKRGVLGLYQTLHIPRYFCIHS